MNAGVVYYLSNLKSDREPDGGRKLAGELKM